MSYLKTAILLSLFLFSSHSSAAVMTYCIPTATIDLNPFREIKDGKELAYLILLRSLISTDPEEPGILEAYSFSPNGKVFSGRLRGGLIWADGSKVTSREVAFGIAKQLKYRSLAAKVRIVGIDSLDANNWMDRNYPGIRIIDDTNFAITFESSIDNLTGALREAFSTNSAHNRFWFIKPGAEKMNQAVVPLFKNEQQAGLIAIGKQSIQLRGLNCSDADYMFGAVKNSAHEYTVRKSPNPSSATLQLDTKRLTKAEREAIAGWVRDAFTKTIGILQLEQADSFFLSNENGYSGRKWSSEFKLRNFPKRTVVLGYEATDFKTALNHGMRLSGVNVELVKLPSNRNDLDGQVLASSLSKGRQIILQDILGWPHVRGMLSNAKGTVALLEKISQKSASTIPVDSITLSEFERVAQEEMSLIPIVRKYSVVSSRKSSPIELVWSAEGELIFKSRR